MKNTIQTERLILKPIEVADAEFFYKEFSTEEVNRFLYDAEPCSGIDEASQWIDFYTEDEPRNQYRWILVLKQNGEKIGTCGFHCWDRDTGEAEMGYDLQPAYWRNGYMTEALTAILQFAAEQMQVKKVYANIFVDNLASVRTAEKVGFVKTGEQYHELFRGKPYLHDIYEYRV